jgi:hypothetical protein
LPLGDRSQGRPRPWLRRFLGPIFGFVALTLPVGAFVQPALAHDGGSMGIGLSAEFLPPGGALEIIGVDFAPRETLQFQLVGSSRHWMLPDVTTGPDGHFAVVLTVPSDAPAGFYTLDAISRSGIIQRATFQVDLAAPAPALTPSPAEPSGAPEAIDLGASAWTFVPFVALGVVAVLFGVIVVRRRGGATIS